MTIPSLYSGEPHVLGCLDLVALDAKALPVALRLCATLEQRNPMVYLLCNGHQALGLATLTQRIQPQVCSTYSL